MTRMSSCSAYCLTWTLVFRGGGHEIFMEQHIYFPVTNIGLCKPDSKHGSTRLWDESIAHRLWYLPSVRSFLFNIPTLPIFSPFLPPPNIRRMPRIINFVYVAANTLFTSQREEERERERRSCVHSSRRGSLLMFAAVVHTGAIG